MNWLERNSDELAALSLVFAGIYLAISKRFEEGMALIGIGTAYLFKKDMKKRGGLPSA